jgi:hypothetical protein
MKKIKTLLLMAAFFASAANAKDTIIELEDESKILGKWKLYAEAAALHKDKTNVDSVWDFRKGGVLASTSNDRRMTSSSEVTVKYSIEDGIIRKQMQPGREKYEDCKVVKLEGKDMTLHCKFNYYFFTKM